MVAVARKSFDELYRVIRDLPEGQRGEILAAGELHVTMGRPGKKHRRAAQVLHHALAARDANVGGTGWWVELEPEVRFGERLFDPDLAAADDVRIKLPGYVAAGVPFVWIIDPTGHLVQVYAARDGKPLLLTTASDEEAARLPPFDVDIDVRRLWTSPKPE
jgi:hypothetical protein